MQYRKKPIVIEAFQWTGGPDQKEDPVWIVKALKKKEAWLVLSGTKDVYMMIETLEGYMKASQGDFIIKGISGELYPCKPDIFHKSYEKVEENPKTPDDRSFE